MRSARKTLGAKGTKTSKNLKAAKDSKGSFPAAKEPASYSGGAESSGIRSVYGNSQVCDEGVVQWFSKMDENVNPACTQPVAGHPCHFKLGFHSEWILEVGCHLLEGLPPVLGADVDTRGSGAVERSEAIGRPLLSESVSASGSGATGFGVVSGAGGCRQRRLGLLGMRGVPQWIIECGV